MPRGTFKGAKRSSASIQTTQLKQPSQCDHNLLYTDAIFKMQVTFEQNLNFFRRLASSLVWAAFETTKLAIEGVQFGHFQLFGNRSIGLGKLRLMIARCLTKD
jgi:hypothetical protein